MQPEISHRCPSCGASLRDRGALFCHECGKPLSKDAQKAAQPGPPDSLRADLALSNEAKESRAEQRTPDAVNETAIEAHAAEEKRATTVKDSLTPEKSAVAQPAPRIGDKTRERLHRASAVARGVIEDEVKRVEKIRHVSTTIVEEASYDPSLRFVLVALGLFIVFVVLLVLSKVMG